MSGLPGRQSVRLNPRHHRAARPALPIRCRRAVPPRSFTWSTCATRHLSADSAAQCFRQQGARQLLRALSHDLRSRTAPLDRVSRETRVATGMSCHGCRHFHGIDARNLFDGPRGRQGCFLRGAPRVASTVSRATYCLNHPRTLRRGRPSRTRRRRRGSLRVWADLLSHRSASRSVPRETHPRGGTSRCHHDASVRSKP